MGGSADATSVWAVRQHMLEGAGPLANDAAPHVNACELLLAVRCADAGAVGAPGGRRQRCLQAAEPACERCAGVERLAVSTG